VRPTSGDMRPFRDSMRQWATLTSTRCMAVALVGVMVAGACTSEENASQIETAAADHSDRLDEAAVYRVIPTSVESAQIENYVSVLNLGLLPRLDDPGLPTLVVGSFDALELVVYRATGAVQFNDNQELWNPDYNLSEAMTSMSVDQLRAIAEQKLRDLQLPVPPSGVPVDVSLGTVEGGAGEALPNHWLVSYSLDNQAVGPRVIPRVLGTTVDIRIGNQDELLGLYHYWPELIEERLTPLLDPPSALARAGLELNDAELQPDTVYLVDGESVRQELASPHYLFEEGDRVIVVPATETGPALVYDENAEMFRIEGGSPPFQVRVVDSASNLLEVASSEVGEERTVELFPLSDVPGPHTLTVIVRDGDEIATDARAVITVLGEGDPFVGVGGAVEGVTAGAVHSHGWSFVAELTDSDGLQIRDLRFRGKPVSSRMNLPYLELRLPAGIQRCELGSLVSDPNGSCDATQVIGEGIEFVESEDGFDVAVTYSIEAELAGDSGSFELQQLYRFEPIRSGCAPLWDPGQCASFYPRVSYVAGIHGSSVGLRTHQRFDLSARSSQSSVFQDPDGIAVLRPRRLPPLETDFRATTVENGSAGEIDNYHERHPRDDIRIPGCSGITSGGWECVHIHWRWSRRFGPRWGNGVPLAGADQTVSITVVAQGSDEQDSLDLSDSGEQVPLGEKAVLWVTSESNKLLDAFGGNHWFIR